MPARKREKFKPVNDIGKLIINLFMRVGRANVIRKDGLAKVIIDTDKLINVSGIKSRRVSQRMIKLLSDEDRLVREAACISLGHMQIESAVPHIVHVW